MTPTPRDFARFYAMSQPEPNSGCWLWTAHVDRHGYGRFSIRRGTYLAHRVSYAYHVGPIQDGLCIDHKCRNRQCVNPAHLEPVTNRENIVRGAKAITACPRGHPYDEENTYTAPDGHRFCRACNRAAVNRLRARKAAA